MTRAVVVLSGGGAKTAAHAGAVQALREAGIEPARFVATSMGAVVAAALAAGVHPSEIPERLAQAGPAGLRAHPLTAGTARDMTPLRVRLPHMPLLDRLAPPPSRLGA